jgi:hypothetical protein
MTQTKEGGGNLVEYRLHLPPVVVMKLKRLALDASEKAGRTIFWSVLAREVLSKAAEAK